MDKVIESFINQCNDMMIVEESTGGDIAKSLGKGLAQGVGAVAGVFVLTPIIIIATMAAIVGICSGVRNLKETANGTHQTAKKYRQLKLAYSYKLESGLKDITKYINSYSSFQVPKTMYDGILVFKKESGVELAKVLNYTNDLNKEKEFISQKNNYDFEDQNEQRDAKICKDLNNRMDAFKKTKLYQMKADVKVKDRPKFPDLKEMVTVTNTDLLSLITPNPIILTKLSFLSDIQDLIFEYDDEIEYDEDSDSRPNTLPDVQYRRYCRLIFNEITSILEDMQNHLTVPMEILKHTKPIK